MTSELTQAALEPCPFCGTTCDTVATIDGSPIEMHSVICRSCGAMIPRATEAEAIAAWNTRLTAQSGEGRSGAGEDAPVLIDLCAHLAAAISLLEKAGKAAKKAAPSDKMFDQMIRDYKRSLDRGRAASKKAFAALNARQSGEGERE